MQRTDAGLVYSATDLNNFLACEHLTGLDRRVALGELERPLVDQPQADILRRLGEQHELRYLEQLRAAGVAVETIERGERGTGIQSAADATVAAMRAGAPVIYQGAFFHNGWLGYADFLRRVDGPSDLGDYHYEVADTKLARNSEPYFLLQLCNYSEHVARVQGAMPERMHVILGDGREESFEVADFAAHYRAVKERFLAHLGNGVAATAPYPVGHCDLCPWQARCNQQLDEADHLSRVARIRRLQIERLGAIGIETLERLSRAADADRPDSMTPRTFDTLRMQARLQREHRDALAAGVARPDTVVVLPLDPNAPQPRGFELLPPRDTGDIFFDMEGDPYYAEGDRWFGEETGLEYLFGIHTPEGTFVPFWGCDRAGSEPPQHRRAEKHAFEAFMDYVMERRSSHPTFHIYHYASYETSALKRLSERHRTREAELDILLREKRFVDLFTVVRQAIAIGQPHYGIKYLEFYYETEQRTGVKKGDDSIVAFESWLASRAAGAPERAILDDIEQYNRFDCVSTEHLLSWLWHLGERRPVVPPAPPLEIAGDEEPSTPQGRAAKARKEQLQGEIVAMVERLRAQLPPDLTDDDASGLPETLRAAWMLSEMLRYHEREMKPVWWEFFARCEAFVNDPGSAVSDSAALGELEVIERTAEGIRMRFPVQAHKVEKGAVHDLGTARPCGRVESIDEDARELLLVPRNTDVPIPRAIVNTETFIDEPLIRSLLRTADGLLAEPAIRAPQDATFDLLLGRAPRMRGGLAGGSIQPARADTASIAPIVGALDGSCLVIQGPPGTGKTSIAAETVLRLLVEGKRIGIAAPSHKVAHNLLDRIGTLARARGQTFRGAHKISGAESRYYPVPAADGGFIKDEKVIKDFGGDVKLFSGTAWLFAQAEAAGTLDYLFVDEAGQVPLVNAIAMAPATRNLVLLGDPQQLSQVSHTSHPGDIGLSALAHVLAGETTVPRDRGIFLDTSWRMHADVCRFVSEISYQGRLHQDPSCDRQAVRSAGLHGAGLHYLPIEHSGNRAESREEAIRIADEIALLLDGEITTCDGGSRPLRPDDIIVVAPYNAQRRLLSRTIHERTGRAIEVGTVNKFQGREAYVVFYSMATSSGDDMPRGTEFLFERNRLNVAVSRARAMAVLVCSPALFETRTPTVDAMRMINGLDRFVELANRA
jgi:uncharacterized protein